MDRHVKLGTNRSERAQSAPGFTPTDYGATSQTPPIERKFREARLHQVAPISTNLVLSYIAEHVLRLPRSY